MLPLQAMPASVGLIMPVALALGSLFWGDDRLLLATCLLPYIETLLSQIWMESYFTKQGRPLLPGLHLFGLSSSSHNFLKSKIALYKISRSLQYKRLERQY